VTDPASGGQATDTIVADFLAPTNEAQTLRRPLESNAGDMQDS